LIDDFRNRYECWLWLLRRLWWLLWLEWLCLLWSIEIGNIFIWNIRLRWILGLNNSRFRLRLIICLRLFRLRWLKRRRNNKCLLLMTQCLNCLLLLIALLKCIQRRRVKHILINTHLLLLLYLLYLLLLLHLLLKFIYMCTSWSSLR